MGVSSTDTLQPGCYRLQADENGIAIMDALPPGEYEFMVRDSTAGLPQASDRIKALADKKVKLQVEGSKITEAEVILE
jgi:hypothetical protein